MSTGRTGPGRPRTGPDPDRRRQVVDAAAKLFLERGYDATSMQHIADAVDLRKASVYHYVPGKEDVLFELIDHFYTVANDTVAGFADDVGDPADRLVGFVGAHVRFVRDNLPIFRIKVREFSQLPETRRDQLEGRGDSYYRVLTSILEDGVRHGVFDADIDVRLATIMIVGQLNSMAQWFHADGPLDADGLAKQFGLLIVPSILAEAEVQRMGGLTGVRAWLRAGCPRSAHTSRGE